MMSQVLRSVMVYLGLAAVFACSFLLAWFLPVGEFVKGATIAPGVSALFLAIWQIFRDHEEHKRQLDLKERDHFFNLSVTSHMANVAFDKHVAFCEEYIAQVKEGVGELFRDGPSKNAMEITRKLTKICNKHAPWVTADVVDKLKPFEDALWKIGTTAIYINRPEAGPNLEKPIDEMYTTFMQVFNVDDKALKEKPGYKDRPEIRVDLILFHLQNVLGITELTRLRRAVVEHAIRSLDNA